ncbi:MAG TPA: hypothetical protein PLV51_08940 [Lentimicrobium sp.]|jgi:hypothetical protein|nr:hypothetical protein [Lentimicrobium sp.]
MVTIPGWLKPAVPKRLLFFAAAMVWAIAAYRVFLLALRYIPEGPLPVWVIAVLGLAGIAVFFNLVFLRVSRKYIRRIAEMEQKNPCLFAFFGWKSYLLIALMAGMGIVFAQYELIPLFLQGIFYISLSGSLLLSALMFINAGVLYKKVKSEDTNPEL